MASYFVAYHAAAFGEVAVHDRSRCPPDCFLSDATTEYLGEFLEARQAVAVARLRYGHARGCATCEPVRRHAALLPQFALPVAPA